MKKILLFIWLCMGFLGFSQTHKKINPADSIKTEKDVVKEIDSVNAKPKKVQTFNPTKAGLYSAILPGLGQYYNKKYWKIPIALGAIGTGVGFILYEDKQYRRYRADYIAELNGQEHEYSFLHNYPGVDVKTVLGNYQDKMKRQRDYAIAITAAVYLLNIIDAVVDAHLYQGRHDPDLALSPTILHDDSGMSFVKPGLALSFRF